MGNNNNGKARTPLLPVGVNNKATMPLASQDYTVRGEEVAAIINVAPGSTPGQVLYNQLITPTTCRRLGILAGAWQRIDWKQASLHLVALNGSLVQSGYTMGWLEDPEITIPTASSEVIPFLTALRSTTVRQNWVESESGVQVSTPDKPEMYTQQGSDVRRYSPGRLVVAVAGDVVEAATFQLMLKYTVRLYVPLAITVGTPSPVVGGYIAIVPAAFNATASTTALSYPGIPTASAPGSTVVLTEPIIGIYNVGAGTSADPAPPNGWQLFPIGTSITLGTPASGAQFTFTVAGNPNNPFAFSRIDVVTGQFRAFQPMSVLATNTNYTVFSISTS